jgi:hypothetical protein
MLIDQISRPYKKSGKITLHHKQDINKGEDSRIWCFKLSVISDYASYTAADKQHSERWYCVLFPLAFTVFVTVLQFICTAWHSQVVQHSTMYTVQHVQVT